MTELTELADEIAEKLDDFYAKERPPRFRYFQQRNGPMFSWSTEKVEGLYASFVHYPRGRGSRSGRAELWVMDEDSIRPHALRKDAKARALRLFNEWKASQ